MEVNEIPPNMPLLDLSAFLMLSKISSRTSPLNSEASLARRSSFMEAFSQVKMEDEKMFKVSATEL